MIGHWLRPTQFKFSALFLTTRCNIICPYCWIPNQHKAELPTAEWKQIIDKLIRWGVIHFSLLGGEPLLRTDLEEMIDYIVQKGGIATVTTNGILLSDQRLSAISSSGLHMLVISLDKLSGQVKGDPNLAFALCAKARAMGIVPAIHCVITSGNIDQIPELAREATKRGFFFSCSTYQAIGGIQSRPLSKLIPTEKATLKMFQQIEKLKRGTGLVRTTYSYMRNYPKYSRGTWHCDPARSSWIVVQSDGELLACTEWKTGTSIFELNEVETKEFYELRKSVTDKCAGCYYECYFSEETVFGHFGIHQLSEIPMSLNFWRHSLDLLRNRVGQQLRKQTEPPRA
ncbi:MAG: radical SAM protein [Thaumarchaeota archaeon]|nr:radical SAM protein [Nitrososphaerota archaeon]